MVGDKFAHSRHLLTFSCDLWLEAREIKIPANFYGQIERIKRDATNAKDEAALRIVTDRFLAVTKKLAVKDRKEYESRSSSAYGPKLKMTSEPKHTSPKNSPNVGLHVADHPRHKHSKTRSASA
jgi:hypothetical protein